MARSGIQVLAALGLIFAIGQIHGRVPPAPALAGSAAFVPRAEVAEWASFGFDAALADWYWLRAIQIVGESSGDASEHAAVLGRMLDVVTTLDPWVDHPYRFAAIWLTDSPESVRLANRLLERGIEHHPDEWRNHFYLGFNHFFYLGENLEAARALERASALPRAPAYLPRLAARLRSQSPDLGVAEAFIAQLARDAGDELLRANYLAALDEISVERRARALDAAREQYRQRHGHDIVQPADLAQGADPLLRELPDAEPASVPPALQRDARWELDESGRIVSSYYGRRYELTFNPSDAARQRSWRSGQRGTGT